MKLFPGNGRIWFVFVVPKPSLISKAQRFVGESTQATTSFTDRIDQYILELSAEELNSYHHAVTEMRGGKKRKLDSMWGFDELEGVDDGTDDANFVLF